MRTHSINCLNYKMLQHFCLARPWLVHACLDLLFTPTIEREPMTIYMTPLRDLKRAAARRISQKMAVVLCKKCNTADARFRTRPAGLTVWTAFFVAAFRQAPRHVFKAAPRLRVQTVSQRRHISGHWLPRAMLLAPELRPDTPALRP